MDSAREEPPSYSPSEPLPRRALRYLTTKYLQDPTGFRGGATSDSQALSEDPICAKIAGPLSTPRTAAFVKYGHLTLASLLILPLTPGAISLSAL